MGVRNRGREVGGQSHAMDLLSRRCLRGTQSALSGVRLEFLAWLLCLPALKV